MRVERIESPDLVQLAFHGRLDAAWSESAAKELEAAIRLGPSRIEVDLLHVEFVSSVGLGVLLRALSRFRAVGGVLVVVDASEEVRRMFRISKLEAMLLGSRAVAATTTTESSSVAIGGAWTGTATMLHAGAGRARIVAGEMLHATPGTLALGHLALAADIKGARGLFGEALAVGGTVAVAPADAPRPDFVTSEDGSGSTCAALQAIAVDGPVAIRARFERSAEAPVRLSSLAAQLATAAGGPIAFAAMGECAGAFGVWARTSPDGWASDLAAMDDAQLRAALRFAGEPMHAGESMVVVGIAALPAHRGMLEARVAASLVDAGVVAMHAHVAIAAYRPVPVTTVDLVAAGRLLAEQPLRGVMHALQATDGVETAFVRGVAWVVRLGEGA